MSSHQEIEVTVNFYIYVGMLCKKCKFSLEMMVQTADYDHTE